MFFLIALAFSYVEYQEGNVLDVRDSANYYDDVVEGNGNNYYTQYYEEGEENGIYEYDGHYVPEDEPAQSMPEYVEKEYANNEEEAEENGEYNYDGKYVPEENLENEGFPIYEQKEYVEEANEENALPYEKEVMVNALG